MGCALPLMCFDSRSRPAFDIGLGFVKDDPPMLVKDDQPVLRAEVLWTISCRAAEPASPLLLRQRAAEPASRRATRHHPHGLQGAASLAGLWLITGQGVAG